MPKNNSQFDINLLKKIMEKEQDVVVAYLFGSRATGNYIKSSDFDIAVYLNRDLDKQERFDLRLSLIGKTSQALNTDNIDLVVINDISSLFFKYIIYKEGELIYQRNVLQRCELESRIMSEYFDFKPFLDEYNRQVLKTV